MISLVYGIIESPSAALAREAARPAGNGGLGPMAATIAGGTPAFRLNSPGWINAGPDIVQGVAGTQALTEYCRARLLNRVSVFALALRSFLSAYVDFAVAEVERRRDELEARLRALGLPADDGFPTYRDWVFSALLPVPQVHVAMPGDADPVAVDVLFWTGRSALALTLEGRTMPTPRQRRAQEAMLAAHPAMKAATLAVPADGHSWALCELAGHFDGALLPDTGLPFGPYRILAG
ncbi:hypothetical protein MWN33_16965 [Starkeya koreensis]|uniref:Uncharacterized protein n=1 Tax=Ancylobacter koreensis TaxID=266121 RepID=A0ABT0DR15_9HYPH|nr:hypothetical protein [Ancylobacter koreensis]MCK0209727.1 hypothetical protein [Ancylobacter koreensis]